jgi:hypothetical protein
MLPVVKRRIQSVIWSVRLARNQNEFLAGYLRMRNQQGVSRELLLSLIVGQTPTIPAVA